MPDGSPITVDDDAHDVKAWQIFFLLFLGCVIFMLFVCSVAWFVLVN